MKLIISSRRGPIALSSDSPVILEFPFPNEPAAKRALLRGACARVAQILRTELGYPGAALALDSYVETLRSPHPVEDDGEVTAVTTLLP